MTPTLRVLYAEDNAHDADLTRFHFSEHAPDFEIAVVTTGEACLDRLRTSAPDLLLLDHHLPDMDGLDVLRTVIRSGTGVPVVLVTGIGDEDLAVKALRLGAANYVPKLGNYIATLPDLLRMVVEEHRKALTEGDPAGTRYCVLYVEHDPSDVDLTLRHFAEAAPHFDMEVVRSSEEALARLAESSFDATVIDLRMPDASGLDLVREAARRRLRVRPFVMVSGKGDEAAAVASVKLGAADYISKRPGYLDHLVHVVDRAIAHHRLRRVNEQLKVELAQRQAAEDSMREANARLAEADRRKDEFIAILSHELRNPLAPIRYALPLLAREHLRESGTRAISVIERQVDYLTRLVDDLLDVSRITRGRIELRLEYVTLGSILTAAVEAASPGIAAARHTLRMAVPEQPIWLHADAARIAQVVTNLLNNSAKYTQRGGEIVLEAGHENDLAFICVRDTGMGIAPELLPTVFQMFHQVTGPDKSKGGLGIGLALVKRLVEMHAGTVEARSAGVGQGAEFIVRLPAVAGPEATEIREQALTPGSSRRLKVLVVDDNADLVEMLGAVVADLGHDVRKALDGNSALSAAMSYRPDVVLLDLGLPVMSGLDVARELRRRPETTGARLVALTGWGQPEDRRQTREAGFDHHLTKPTDPRALADLLTKLAADAG